jgi:hypothetical protein
MNVVTDSMRRMLPFSCVERICVRGVSSTRRCESNANDSGPKRARPFCSIVRRLPSVARMRLALTFGTNFSMFSKSVSTSHATSSGTGANSVVSTSKASPLRLTSMVTGVSAHAADANNAMQIPRASRCDTTFVEPSIDGGAYRASSRSAHRR